MDSTIKVRVVNGLKSKLYAPMTARLKKSREQETFRNADHVISDMRSKYGL